MVVQFFFVTICLYFLVFYIIQYYKRRTSHPGPFPLPILGSLPQALLAGMEGHLAFHELAKKYGDVFSLKIGSHDYVIVNSVSGIKEILSHPDAQGRPLVGYRKDRNWDGKSDHAIGILMSEGDFWTKKRSWILKTLRDYGFGISSSMQLSANEEATLLLGQWETALDNSSSGDNPVILNASTLFDIYTSKLIWKMFIGRFNSDDEDRLKSYLKKNAEYFEASILGLSMLMVAPSLKNIFPKITSYDKIMNAVHEGKNMGKKYLTEYSKMLSLSENEKPANFVEAYLHQSKNNPDFFFDADFQQIFIDFLQGGTDTTSSFLESFFLVLVVFQDIQQKLYDEMVRVSEELGRPLKVEDLSLMTYVKATFLEVHRIAAVAAVPPFRKATKDIYHNGFKIRKGTIIQANMFSAFHSNTFGEDFEHFRPERFLRKTEDIKWELNDYLHKLMIQFGVGKRACPGQRLAEVSTFTLIASTLSKFKVIPVPGQNPPNFQFKSGLTIKPKPFKFSVVKRK